MHRRSLHLLLFSFLALHASFIKTEETLADIFIPVHLDYLYALVDAHPERQEELDHMFTIEKTLNIKNVANKKVLAFSLFWKAVFLTHEQPFITKETIFKSNRTQLKKNMKKGGKKPVRTFYDKYVRPLFEQIKTAKKVYPGWIPRVYLAKDLELLAPLFVALDCEVIIMACSSARAAPGTMWRFLVFDDPQVDAVYVRDADSHKAQFDGDFGLAPLIKKWINDTATAGFFRLRDMRLLSSQTFKIQKPSPHAYSTILAGCFGGKKVDWINMAKAMKGFILHRQLLAERPLSAEEPPEIKHPFGFGAPFPVYGFDETFLKHVLYFAAADRDQLTLISTDSRALHGKKAAFYRWFALDLAYTKNKTYGPF